jgi:hypothetical protein
MTNVNLRLKMCPKLLIESLVNTEIKHLSLQQKSNKSIVDQLQEKILQLF